MAKDKNTNNNEERITAGDLFGKLSKKRGGEQIEPEETDVLDIDIESGATETRIVNKNI